MIHPDPLTPQSANSTHTESLSQSRRRWLIVISLLAVGICACVGIGAFTVGRGLIGISNEQAVITPVLDSFMQAMVANDANRAYQQFSTRAQRQTKLSDVEALLTGANYVLFDGYQSLAITSTNLSAVTNTNPDVPQGQVATVSGTISYTGNVQGQFRATLEKEAGVWRLDAINITVPPSKTLP